MIFSRRENRIRSGSLLLSLLLIAVLLFFIPVRADAAYTASVNMKQSFIVYRPYGLRVQDTFTYQLTALNGAPVENEQTFTLKGNETKTLNFSFDWQGDYEYQLKLSQNVKLKNYSYDESVYKIRIYTKADHPIVIIYNEKGDKVSSILYRHSYNEPYIPPIPKTGDDFSIIGYGVMLTASAGIFIFLKKKLAKRV